MKQRIKFENWWSLRRRFSRNFFLAMISSLLLIPSTIGQTVQVWFTEGDNGTEILEKKADITPASGSGSQSYNIVVDESTTTQEIVGYGAAMTEASAHLIYNSPYRDEIMEKIFSKENGAGVNLVRVTIGSSDHALSAYSYEDTQGNFTITRDMAEKIPLLQQAKAINPDLQFMGSPWSAPGWMKTSNGLNYGSLKPEYYDEYAQYLVNFIQAYEAEGIPMHSITIQNEPLHEANYPTMKMSKTECAEFVKVLGPLFETNNITTKIIVYDHNFFESGDAGGINYPKEIYDDPEASQYVAGAGWHSYDPYPGSPDQMTILHNQYPDKGNYFTERTGQRQPWWGDTFDYFLFTNIERVMENWAKCALMWNIALDENGGPRLDASYNGSGFVTVYNGSGNYEVMPDLAGVGHYSVITRPGAIRIESTDIESATSTNGLPDGVYSESYNNPDGSTGIMVYNRHASTNTISVTFNNMHWDYTLPAYSAVSFLVNGEDVSDVPVAGVELLPEAVTFEEGQSANLTATVLPSNATNKAVTWSSSNTNVATVDANGVLTAVSVGTTTITVTTEEGGFTDVTEATVSEMVIPVTSVSVDISILALVAGESANLTATVSPSNATNQSVTWSSSNTNVATVDANGNVTAVAEGSATITATSIDGPSDTTTVSVSAVYVPVTSVSVTPQTIDIIINESASIAATVSPSNATNKAVTWASSDELIATVDASGNVTAVALGTANIAVTTVDGNYTDVTTVITQEIPSCIPNIPGKIEAEDYTYQSGIQTENTEDDGGGLNVGWIDAADILEYDGICVANNGTYNLESRVAGNGHGGQFELQDQDGNVLAVVDIPNTFGWQNWTSVNQSVQLSQSVTKLVIVMTSNMFNLNWFEFTADGVDVPVDGVELLPETLTLDEGQSANLTATVSPSDATNQSVTWSSGDESVATVDADGNVTAVAEGNATITVTTVDGSFTDVTNVTVSAIPTYTLSANATNGSVTLSPAGGTYAEGTVVTLTASANSDYEFDNWSGDASGSNNPITITMDGNKSVTANFSSNGGGQIPDCISFNCLNGIYAITNKNSNKDLVSSGSEIVQSSSSYDYWLIEEITWGMYKITNQGNGLAITVNGFSGTNMSLSTYTGAASQLYRFEDQGDHYHIFSSSNGIPLDIAGQSTSDGANLSLQWFSGQQSQDWFLDANKAAADYTITTKSGSIGESRISYNLTANSGMLIYPNPAGNTLTISGISENELVEIYNTLGARVLEHKGAVIDVNNLSTGLYLIKVSFKGNTELIKFIKE